jgi:cysteinyl-tRNA synthetase
MLDENHEKSTPDLRAAMANIRRGILQIGAVLGLFQEDAQAYLKGKKSVAAEKMEIDAKAVRQLIKARDEARKNKDWATADSIRDQLAEMQVVLEDRPDETVWKIKTDS